MDENNNNNNNNDFSYEYNKKTSEAIFGTENINPEILKEPKKENTGFRKVIKAFGMICCIAFISVGSIAVYKYLDDKEQDSKPSSNISSAENRELPDKDKSDIKDDSSKTDEVISEEERDKYIDHSLFEIASDSSPMSAQAIYKKVMPSVVGVSVVYEQTSVSFGFWDFGESSTSEVPGTGTGIIMSEDGYILTNAHVVCDESYGIAKSVSIRLYDESEYDAKIVGYDTQTDIAVLKIDKTDLTPAEFGSSSSVVVGDPALAIGNPLGFDLFGTLTVGYISGLGREISVNDTKMTLIQTDAAINSGNSGGPLINDSGQVIGINSMKISSSYTASSASVEGLGFAIPIDEAKKVIDDLMAYGYVTGRPQLGITYKDLSESASAYYTQGRNTTSGVMVISVNQGGPADKAGVKAGDIIVGANGELVTGANELNEAISECKSGDTIKLTVIRNRNYYDVDIILEDKVPDKTH